MAGGMNAQRVVRLFDEDASPTEPQIQRALRDIEEILEDAGTLADLAAPGANWSRAMAVVTDRVAHLQSHWLRLAEETGWLVAYESALRDYRKLNTLP